MNKELTEKTNDFDIKTRTKCPRKRTSNKRFTDTHNQQIAFLAQVLIIGSKRYFIKKCLLRCNFLKSYYV